MGSFGVVVSDPGADQFAGMGQVAEQGLVKKLVAQPAVEAFHKARGSAGTCGGSPTALPHAARARTAAGSRTSAAHWPDPAGDRAVPYPARAATGSAQSSGLRLQSHTPAVPTAQDGPSDARLPRASRQALPFF